MITAIELNKLVISPENVRVLSASKARDKELISGIRASGLLQNLVVVQNSSDQFEVIAGGRRLAALQSLAKEGVFTDDYPVSCLVKDRADVDVTQISLQENVQREAMHPADQFVAFAKMLSEGSSVVDVSESFGVSKKIVEQRLALGRVHKKLMGYYRKGDLNLDCMMAFTVTDDTERQVACYKELSKGNIWPRSIKSWLLGESITTAGGIGAFVGRAAYVKAGGAVSSDLFEETVYLLNVELVEELAETKLGKEADKLIKACGWSWVEVALNPDTGGLVQLQPQLCGVPKKMAEKIERMQAELSALNDLGCEQDWPEDIDQKYDALAEEIEKAENARDEKYLRFSKEQQSYSGCIVTFSRSGELSVLEGLARKEDVPQSKPATNGDATCTESDEQEAKGISQALRDDLRAYRQQIVQANLLTDPAAATDVLHYSMACQVLGDRYDSGAMVNVQFSRVESTTSRSDTDLGRAFDELCSAERGLNTEWLAIEDRGERFIAYRALSQKDKTSLLVYCVSVLLSVDNKGRNLAMESLISGLEIPFSDYWRPTEDNYLKRISVAQLENIFSDVTQHDYCDAHNDRTKGAVIVNVLEALSCHEAGKTWLPEQF